MAQVQRGQTFQQADLWRNLGANDSTSQLVIGLKITIRTCVSCSGSYLTELVATQVEFLQSGPLVYWSAQIHRCDAVLTEHQLSQVARRPESRARKNSNVVGSHVH